MGHMDDEAHGQWGILAMGHISNGGTEGNGVQRV